MTDCGEAELVKCIDLLRKACWRQWNGRHQECHDALQQLDAVLAKLPDLSDQPRCREQASGDDGGGSVQAIIDKWGVPLDSSFIPMLHEAFCAGRSQPTPNAERKEQPPPASDEEIDVQKIMSEQWSQSHKPYICYRKGKERGLALGRSQVLAAIQKAANGVTLDIPLN